jgi:hypothetical protein
MSPLLYQELFETECEYQSPSESDILPYLSNDGERESDGTQESNFTQEAREGS